MEIDGLSVFFVVGVLIMVVLGVLSFANAGSNPDLITWGVDWLVGALATFVFAVVYVFRE